MQTPLINSVRQYGMSDEFDWDVTDDIHFKNIVAYRAYTGAFGVSQSQIALPVQEVDMGVSHRQFSEEARLLGDLWDNRVEWTVGAFYLNTYSNNNPGTVDDEGFGIYVPGPAKSSTSSTRRRTIRPRSRMFPATAMSSSTSPTSWR